MSTNYPQSTWRLLVTPPLDGATNMAIDEAILYALAEQKTQPTLRFYQWQPACLSLGYNQKWVEINQIECAAQGVTWTRRATGGKAIFHTDELTYSLITHNDDPRIEGGILRSYKALSQALLQGLKQLGVEVRQAEKRTQPRSKADRKSPVCFDTPAQYELIWQGKKLVGSAQLRRKNIVLQHGSLPLHGNLKRILNLLHLSPEERHRQEQILPQRATTLEHATGYIIPFEQVRAALVPSFATQFNLNFVEANLNSAEEALVEQLRTSQYANENWNKRV
ncbi:lipoate--protein ligase family protein [Anaerolineales bacterium HSG25]|nr:lipoate--protein ligase family protein [Anaerolineales bacterium HSG25]